MNKYYNDIISFKKYFITHCHANRKYDAHKVWAQWIIRNLCQSDDIYHLIPINDSSNDNDLIEHLKLVGVENHYISDFVREITQHVSILRGKYHDAKTNQLTDCSRQIEDSQCIRHTIECRHGVDYHIFEWNNVYIKYDELIYDSLCRKYIGSDECFNFCMFEMGFNYYILDGHSLQWCVPPKVMNILCQHLSVDTELFASPMNVYLSHYYSLFWIDKMFGSLGNFFSSQLMNMGSYEVNPPFIEKLFVDSSDKIITNLQQNNNLLYVYIMPNWLDSLGYQRLKNSGYLLDELVLNEKEHHYYHSIEHKLINVNFRTHILILSTTQSKLLWTNEIKTQIMLHFTSN